MERDAAPSGRPTTDHRGARAPMTGPSQPAHFDIALLRRAIAIYLERAYPPGTIPEVVKRRLDWPDDLDLPALLESKRFERVKPMDAEGGPIYALRLGNHEYAHMKLQIQGWPSSDGYLLSVNTHDQIQSFASRPADQERFRPIREENQRIKEAIEQAWEDDGLPTFLAYLRSYINSQQGAPPAP